MFKSIRRKIVSHLIWPYLDRLYTYSVIGFNDGNKSICNSFGMVVAGSRLEAHFQAVENFKHHNPGVEVESIKIGKAFERKEE